MSENMERVVALRRGDTLDEFIVGDYLGEGKSRSARVYAANASTALKLYTEDINPTHDNIRYEKFKNEVVLLNKLKESVYVLNAMTDFRETAEHEGERKLVPYYGMELMDGNLESLVVDPLLSIQEKIKLSLQVVDGLLDCHVAKICHRDIYTPNILYKKVAGQVTCKYADFGSAKLHGALQPAAYFTPMGNLEYTSPEALVGMLGGEKPDINIMKASDVFAIGLVIYEIITGLKQENLNTALVGLQLKIEHDGMWGTGVTFDERDEYLNRVVLPLLNQIRIEPVNASDILDSEVLAKYTTDLINGMLSLNYKVRLVDLAIIRKQLLSLLSKVEES